MQRKGHMQKPRGKKEPAVSGKPQVVQHYWNGKCQGWWWAHTGQKARWAQTLGAL